jgi:hydrocephalus-inducing protein
MSIVSGPKYDFFLFGDARKPGIELSFNSFDFGPCFVMTQPMSKTATLEMINNDNSAITIETLFEKNSFLDV